MFSVVNFSFMALEFNSDLCDGTRTTQKVLCLLLFPSSCFFINFFVISTLDYFGIFHKKLLFPRSYFLPQIKRLEFSCGSLPTSFILLILSSCIVMFSLLSCLLIIRPSTPLSLLSCHHCKFVCNWNTQIHVSSNLQFLISQDEQ